MEEKGRRLTLIVLGIGLGIIIETLLFLSPLFERAWESSHGYVKLIPLGTLILAGVIGLAVLLTALLFLGVLVTIIPGGSGGVR